MDDLMNINGCKRKSISWPIALLQLRINCNEFSSNNKTKVGQTFSHTYDELYKSSKESYVSPLVEKILANVKEVHRTSAFWHIWQKNIYFQQRRKGKKEFLTSDSPVSEQAPPMWGIAPIERCKGGSGGSRHEGVQWVQVYRLIGFNGSRCCHKLKIPWKFVEGKLKISSRSLKGFRRLKGFKGV